MDVDVAFERLRKANPVPDADRHARSPETISTRRPDMTTDLKPVETTDPERPDRRWIPAAVAAAVVIAILIALPFLIGSDEGETPDVVATTPVQPDESAPGLGSSEAEALVRTAVGLDGDPAAAQAAFAPEAVVTGIASVESAERWAAWIEYHQAIGAERTDLDCGDMSPRGEITCSFEYSTAISRASGGTDATTVTVHAGFGDGLITRWDETAVLSEDMQQSLDDFVGWLGASFPTDVEKMVRSDDPSAVQLGAESIGLWGRYSAAYVEFLSNEEILMTLVVSSPETDPETAASLFADDAAILNIAHVDGPEDWIGHSEYHNAIGSEQTDFECIGKTGATDVQCTFAYSNAISRALGLEDPGTVTVSAAIADGRVTRFVQDSVDMSEEMLNASFFDFAAWLETTHPEDAGFILSTDQGWVPNIEPAAIALWEQYIDEYVTEIGG